MFNIDVNLFNYISVRAFLAFLFAFLLSVFIMPLFIAWAKTHANQPILEDVSIHQSKKNTPTMGGIVFVLTTLIASFCFIKINEYVIAAYLSLILFSLIGVIDDLKKVLHKKNKAGLSAKVKMLLLIIASILTLSPLYFASFDTNFYLPFFKYAIFDMGIFAFLFWILVLISSANAINLTDGLDGLACVPSIFSIFTLSVFVYLSSNALYANYLLLPKIANIEECCVLALALIGSLLGFLWYNCHPAQIFMGDSGSLALGGFIGYLAIITKNEILLILIGFIFVIETISVILQVSSFKIFKKRIFKMTPIHHHFEQIGWSENKIIIRFWMIAFLCCLFALITIKIR